MVLTRVRSDRSEFKKHYDERETKLKQFLKRFLFVNEEQKIRAIAGERHGAKGRFRSKSKNS